MGFVESKRFQQQETDDERSKSTPDAPDEKKKINKILRFPRAYLGLWMPPKNIPKSRNDRPVIKRSCRLNQEMRLVARPPCLPLWYTG